MRQGDSLFTFSEAKLRIDYLYQFRTDTATTVFNLEVVGNHNYYVSASGVLVHNCEKSFFEGTKYTKKVLAQMKTDPMHGFPELVKNMEKLGTIEKIKGGDKIIREMLKIPGYYKGKDGFFEFMKEADGTINHRFFRPNR